MQPWKVWEIGHLDQASSQKFAMGEAILGAEPPVLENFAFFAKITYFRAISIKNNAVKTRHRNWQCKMIQVVALMGYVGGA